MKSCNVVICITAFVLALSFLTVGCGREVSKTSSSSVSRDGTVKTQEKTVTESPDGTVTTTQETKTTEPNNN